VQIKESNRTLRSTRRTISREGKGREDCSCALQSGGGKGGERCCSDDVGKREETEKQLTSTTRKKKKGVGPIFGGKTGRRLRLPQGKMNNPLKSGKLPEGKKAASRFTVGGRGAHAAACSRERGKGRRRLGSRRDRLGKKEVMAIRSSSLTDRGEGGVLGISSEREERKLFRSAFKRGGECTSIHS